MLGVGCKQPLRYFYCSESVLYPGAIIPAGTWKVQTPWGLHREMICHALPWDFLLPPPATVLHPPPQGSAWSWWGELALGGCQLSSLQRQMTAAAFGGPDASANLVVTNVAVTHPGVEMTAAYFSGAAVGTGWWYSFLSHPIPPSREVEDAKAI